MPSYLVTYRLPCKKLVIKKLRTERTRQIFAQWAADYLPGQEPHFYKVPTLKEYYKDRKRPRFKIDLYDRMISQLTRIIKESQNEI